MKKVIDFCKQKYKILIPIMVVLVLLIVVYFLYREYRYDNYRDKKEAAVYQYFVGNKIEYTAIVTYNLKKVIVDIEGKNAKINYDSTPVYYQNEDTIIFPEEMTIVFPLKGGVSYRINKYTIYGMKDEFHQLISGRINEKYNHFFLYDGKGLYFFTDEIKLKINDEDFITLSPNSYAQIVGEYSLIYYDKENDKSEVIDIYGKNVVAENDNVKVDLTDAAYYIFGKRSLLNQPGNLNPLLN